MANSSSPFDCIIFDLDDTLYSGDLGINAHMRTNIEDYLVDKCGITKERACELRAELFRSYGSSFIGLRALGYDVHPDDYHSFVHGRLPYDIIRPDPYLHGILQSIPQKKILFTNSDRAHARRALERLGIDERLFTRIICFETLNPHLFISSTTSSSKVVLKPSPSAMEIAVRIAGTEPHRTLFLDDSERNISAGKALGLCTALVGKKERIKQADYVVDSMENLRSIIPEIWHEEKKRKVDKNKKGGDEAIVHEVVLLRHNDMDSSAMATTYVEA